MYNRSMSRMSLPNNTVHAAETLGLAGYTNRLLGDSQAAEGDRVRVLSTRE